MINILFSRLVAALSLFLLQILVFNHVRILGYATPFPYIFALLLFPLSVQRWFTVTAGFLLGLAADMFTGTLGMQAAAGALLGLLQPHMLKRFKPVSLDEESMLPSSRTLGWGTFMHYAISCAFLFCAAFYILESFDFILWKPLLINVIGSTTLTSVAIFFLEEVHRRI